eukprot:PhM_4_TR5764/c0_g1_i1/m.83501
MTSLWDLFQVRLRENNVMLDEIDGADDGTLHDVLSHLKFGALDRARIMTEWKKRRGAVSTMAWSSPRRQPEQSASKDQPEVARSIFGSPVSPGRGLEPGERPCTMHPHKATEIFCWDCQRLICTSCIAGEEHTAHRWTSVPDASSQSVPEASLRRELVARCDQSPEGPRRGHPLAAHGAG